MSRCNYIVPGARHRIHNKKHLILRSTELVEHMIELHLG